MVQIGAHKFDAFSVPLVFESRYFIFQPETPPRITVVHEVEEKPVFEVLKNEPCNNPLTQISKAPTGVITASEKESGQFMYKIHPDSETHIAFGRIDGGEIQAIISDKIIQVGVITLPNCPLTGNMAGVLVRPDGSTVIGAMIPPHVLSWLEHK